MNNSEIIDNEIRELEQREINYSNAEKLAWLYVIRDHWKPTAKTADYNYNSGTEFSESIKNKSVLKVFGVIDELMDTLSTLSPKLYNAAIDRLKSL